MNNSSVVVLEPLPPEDKQKYKKARTAISTTTGTSKPKQRVAPVAQGVGQSSSSSSSSSSDDEEDSEEEEEEADHEGVIRCPCDDNTDHGLMIQCEACLVWQHSLCVGIREDKSVPAHYFCETCLPRNFNCICEQNTAHGKLIQCAKCSTWQHIKCLGKAPRTLPKPYYCPKCSPEYFEYLKQKKIRGSKSKKIKEFEFVSNARIRMELEKDFLVLSKKSKEANTDHLDVIGKRYIEKYCTKCCEFQEVDAELLIKALSILVGRPPNAIEKHLTEHISVILEGKYLPSSISSELKKEHVLAGWTRVDVNIQPYHRAETPAIKGLSCYELHQKRELERKEHSKDICTHNNCVCRQSHQECSESCPCACAHSSITAICGNRPTKPIAVDIVPFGKHWGLSALQDVNPNRFIIEYTGRFIASQEVTPTDRPFLLSLNESTSIDARTHGSNARFIRRSCKPNAEVRPIYRNNKLHANVYSLRKVQTGEEITIPFDFSWKDVPFKIHCACNSVDCELNSWYAVRAATVPKILDSLKNKDQRADMDEGKGSKTPVSASPAMEDAKKISRKDSREERKIAAVLKSFEKIESRQNKKRNKAPREPKEAKRQKQDQDTDEDVVIEDLTPSDEDRTKKEASNSAIPVLSRSPKMPSATRPDHRNFDKSPKLETTTVKIETNTAEDSNSTLRNQVFPGRKKAWIMEYEQQQNQKETSESETPKEIDKLPVKKKMLDNFFNTSITSSDTASPVANSNVPPFQNTSTVSDSARKT